MDKRPVARGYPPWAWILGALFLFPLVPMLIGATIPRARIYLGAPGIIISSIALIVVIGIIGTFSGGTEYSSPQSGNARLLPTPTPALSRDDRCLKTQGCAVNREDWLIQAAGHCTGRIESVATYGARWIKDDIANVFDSSLTAHRKGASGVLYLGNNIEFLDDSGDWHRMEYECLYNPLTKYPVNVVARPYSR